MTRLESVNLPTVLHSERRISVVFVRVCEAFFDKDSSLGCTSESGVHKINTGREWESIACPLFALYIHCFPFFGQILKLNKYTELASSGWHIFFLLQAILSAALRIYIAHSWQIYRTVSTVLFENELCPSM